MLGRHIKNLSTDQMQIALCGVCHTKHIHSLAVRTSTSPYFLQLPGEFVPIRTVKYELQ